jgi:hypothetical protein
MSNVILDLDSIWVSIFTLTVISIFSKEITVHILGSFGGTKYMETGIKYVKELKYLLSNINFLHDQK